MNPDKDSSTSESPASNMPAAPAGSTPPNKTKPRKNLKKFIKPALVSAVILGVVGIGVWYILNNFVGWRYKTLENGDTKFSFRFNPVSKQVDKEGTPFLQGNDLNNQSLINVSMQKVDGTSDCSDYLTPQFNVKVGKKQYPVCADEGELNFVYFSNFEKGGSWYSATILSEDEKTKPNEATIQKIISSVKIKAVSK